MNVGSLFSGAGLMDWGLTLAGFEHAWFCETDPYCQQVLALRYPDVPIYGDVRALRNPEPVDVLAGGFPCQPFSAAGVRKGTEDERWLWPEFARLIGLLRPPYVLVENVPGLAYRGGGMGRVLGDLAALGYDAEWDSLPAAAFGAPHIRDRIFILAYPSCPRHGPDVRGAHAGEGEDGPKDAHEPEGDGRGGRTGHVADAEREGELQPQGSLQEERGRAGDGGQALSDTDGTGRQDAEGCSGQGTPGRAIFSADHARRGPYEWPPEPDVGRVAHGVPARMDRLRALGNGVVPPIARFLGERILEREGVR